MSSPSLPEAFLKASPSIHPEAFVAEGARITGDVRLAAGASIWYNCVLRGDLNFISVGENTNIQDGSILHVEASRPCVVGDGVTIGHGAIVHACTVESGCLIGMGAIILSGAVIGRGSVIGAGALVRENTVVEPCSLWVGLPARFSRRVPEQMLAENLAIAERYVEAARRHRELALRGPGTQQGI